MAYDRDSCEAYCQRWLRYIWQQGYREFTTLQVAIACRVFWQGQKSGAPESWTRAMRNVISMGWVDVVERYEERGGVRFKIFRLRQCPTFKAIGPVKRKSAAIAQESLSTKEALVSSPGGSAAPSFNLEVK